MGFRDTTQAYSVAPNSLMCMGFEALWWLRETNPETDALSANMKAK